MALDYNESVGNALNQYLTKIGLKGLNLNSDHGIVFIYNGNKIKSSDNKKTVGEYFKNGSNIIVLDTKGPKGA